MKDKVNYEEFFNEVETVYLLSTENLKITDLRHVIFMAKEGYHTFKQLPHSKCRTAVLKTMTEEFHPLVYSIAQVGKMGNNKFVYFLGKSIDGRHTQHTVYKIHTLADSDDIVGFEHMETINLT